MELLNHQNGTLYIQRDKLRAINLHLAQINGCIRLIDEKLDYFRQKYSGIIRHLATMTGVTEASALYILGGIGTDMSAWRDGAAPASWAGLSPANNASAGNRCGRGNGIRFFRGKKAIRFRKCSYPPPPIQESINGSPVLISGSKQGRALNHHPKDPAAATVTA